MHYPYLYDAESSIRRTPGMDWPIFSRVSTEAYEHEVDRSQPSITSQYCIFHQSSSWTNSPISILGSGLCMCCLDRVNFFRSQDHPENKHQNIILVTTAMQLVYLQKYGLSLCLGEKSKK